jgi:Cupin-like domain
MTDAFPSHALAEFEHCYPEQSVRLSHTLSDHPLLTLEALVTLAGKLDPKNVEYNPGDLPIGIAAEDVPSPRLSIAETIRSIEENGSWMVLKFIEHDPAYAKLLAETLSELRKIVEPKTGEMLTLQGFIFISSPGAVTPFHFDPEHNILLQVRGSKVFTIFPQGDEAVVSATAHEAFHVGEQHRNLEWRDDLAARGTPVPLSPGDAILVPVKAPHWVKVDAGGPSISLSVTWRSEWSYKEADARGLNRLLRKSGLTPATPGRWPAQNEAKSVAYRALRKARLTGR